MEPFKPEHLSKEELRQFQANTLKQAEANVCNAWVNYQMAAAAYEAAKNDFNRQLTTDHEAK